MNEDDPQLKRLLRDIGVEVPDEKSENSLDDGLTSEQRHHRHYGHWIGFWIATLAGTSLAGSLFGLGLGLFSGDLLMGAIFGLAWAGGVGAFVFLHVGVVCWIFWLLGRPLLVATIAGSLTGLICGLVIFSILTGPMGGFGAYWFGKKFIESDAGKVFMKTIKQAGEESDGRLRFTTTDLLWRMTIISVMIAGWMALINSGPGF